MALLMDSLDSLDHSVRRKYKKVFEKLGDEYIVRTPVFDDMSIASIVIEGPNRSWLCIGNHHVLPNADDLKEFVSLNMALKSSNFSQLTYLAVCKEGESLFSTLDESLESVAIVEQSEFWKDGGSYIQKFIREFCFDAHNWLKKILVFESFVNNACTTRRERVNGNADAKLHDLFLDYDQELATKYDIWGDSNQNELDEKFSVRLINGVAGCGKTLILINRALLFCKKYPDKKVLLLIHNRPVTADIEYKFENYLDGRPNNLTIKTFHAYARSQQIKLTPKIKILFSDKEKKPFLDKLFSDKVEAYVNLSISDDQIWSEIEYINEFLIAGKDEYLVYERLGRGFSLSKSQRENVWKLYQASRELMSSPETGFLPSFYIRNLCLEKNGRVDFDTYDQILIDEAQFFFPSWLELVKNSVEEGGQIFLCADPNQGFLKSRLSWKSIGLSVRGRTKKLSYSYRTTYEIMVAANALLEHLNEDSEDFIQPNLEKMTRGSKPTVIYIHNAQDEERRFINELAQCVNESSIPLQHIIVLCSDSVSPWSVKTLVQAKLGEGTVVNCNDSRDIQELGGKVRVMSINSCTGMEAGVIFVLGVGSLLDKVNNLDLNEDEKAVVDQESTRKLYVAMTRAGQKLVLFSTETLPASVEPFVNVVS